jgi:hypothetical protein
VDRTGHIPGWHRRFSAVNVPDNLRARQARTQIQPLERVVIMAITVPAVAMMLLTLPQGRALGASLLASAGIAGVALALRSATSSRVCRSPSPGPSAWTTPWSWRASGATSRRSPSPTWWCGSGTVAGWCCRAATSSNTPSKNWTRYTADIVCTVVYVDYEALVGDLRAELERILTASTLWNGQTAVLQVVDATERIMVLRALVSADSAPNAGDLRCEVRERLLGWLQRQHRRCCRGCVPSQTRQHQHPPTRRRGCASRRLGGGCGRSAPTTRSGLGGAIAG